MMAESPEANGVDEARIARLVAIGLPVATVATALVVGFMIGPATAILVLAAGVLLGVISIFWASIRILSGDAQLDPELESLDVDAGGDPLVNRRKMLLRALKDVETERGLGKIAPEDYEQIVATYRGQLKVVLRHIDEALAPHRAQAEELAREHLLQAGVATPMTAEAPSAEPSKAKKKKAATATTAAEDPRLACPSCGASNEKDAKFCKECAASLHKAGVTEKVEDANA